MLGIFFSYKSCLSFSDCLIKLFDIFERLTHDDIEQNIVQQSVPEHSRVEKSVLKCSSGEQGELKWRKFALLENSDIFWT